MIQEKKIKLGLSDLLRRKGFMIIILAVVICFSLLRKSFMTVDNMMGLLHASAPMAVLATGLVLVVLTGKLDISIGSIAFFSSAAGSVLMFRYDVSPYAVLPLILAIGGLCGFINGIICNYLKVNPLITTMGAMFVYRGLALQLTKSRNIAVSEAMHAFGNFRIGPVFTDILIALSILLFFHVLLAGFPFGRSIMALGNSQDIAEKLGIRTRAVSVATFTLSGLCASMGGILMISQIGSVTTLMGTGAEFSAIAAIVIGGISLFGGEGNIFPNFAIGVLALALIENGLNHLGASPYIYPFVRGGIILMAMYADSLKRSVNRLKIK